MTQFFIFFGLFLLNLVACAINVAAGNNGIATWNGGLALLMLVFVFLTADDIR